MNQCSTITARIAFIAVLALAQSPNTEAATSKSSASLRGVTLGSSFSQSFQECPKRKNPILGNEEYWPTYDSGYPTASKDVPCFKTVSERSVVDGATQFEIDNLPFIKGAGRSVIATVFDDRIISIKFDFLVSYKDQFFQAMLEKYGNAARLEEKTYQNGFGQVFVGRLATWTGSDFSLSYDEYGSGKKDWGTVRLTADSFIKMFSEKLLNEKEQIKSKL